MHTHYGSITFGTAVFIPVLLLGTFWRIGWMHLMQSKNRHARGFAKAALSQF